MNNYEEEWDNVWSANNWLSKLVEKGRNHYNIFFMNLFKVKNSQQKNILEIGCGTSSLLLKLAKDFKEVVGLDISDEALKISNLNALKMGVRNSRFVKGDCFNLPFKDNSFDFVWSQGLIEHFDDPKKIVLEHYRVCKKNGVVLISTPAKYSYQFLWYKLTRPVLLRRFWPWTDQTFYTRDKYHNIMQGISNKYQIFYLSGDWTRAFIILKVEK